jgi:hypothetical protein
MPRLGFSLGTPISRLADLPNRYLLRVCRPHNSHTSHYSHGAGFLPMAFGLTP